MSLYFYLRCLLDTDDEVRDRATFYVNILKEKEKALSSGYILNGWFIKVLTNQLEKIEFLFQNFREDDQCVDNYNNSMYI